MNSILSSIKLLLGITEDYKVFDEIIIIYINSALAILNQLGVGPDDGFSIKDEKDTWNDFIDNDLKLEDVKTFVYFKVRLAFDPPASSAAIDSMERMIKELEWRINVTAETPE